MPVLTGLDSDKQVDEVTVVILSESLNGVLLCMQALRQVTGRQDHDSKMPCTSARHWLIELIPSRKWELEGVTAMD